MRNDHSYLITNKIKLSALSEAGRFQVRVQTRNSEHPRARELAILPNVTLQVGHIESEEHLREAMANMDGVFFLANGFSIGEKAELLVDACV